MKSLFFGRHLNNSMMLICLAIFFSSCSNKAVKKSIKKPDGELLEFAKVNCFFCILKRKIMIYKNISGGIVEIGSYSADKYQQVSLLVKEYLPSVSTKQNIDTDLQKCFLLGKDAEFIRSLNNTK